MEDQEVAVERPAKSQPNVLLRIFNAVWMFALGAGIWCYTAAAGKADGARANSMLGWMGADSADRLTAQADMLEMLSYVAFGAAALFALLAVVVAVSKPSQG